MVDVSISQVADDGTTTQAECWFDAPTGAASVPAEVLATLAPGSATIVVGVAARAVALVGDYDVAILASQEGIGVTGTLTLE